MYISRVRLRRDHQRLSYFYQRDVYTEHQLLMSLFPADTPPALRPLFRRDEHGRAVVYYLVSAVAPVMDHPVLHVESKPYQPQFQPGDVLHFNLRANAVVARKDAAGKSRRHDVVMDYKKRIGYQQMPRDERPSQAQLAQAAGWEWLQPRMENNGFTTDAENIRVDTYQTHHAYQNNSRRSIRYSTLDYAGIVRVTDPQRFVATLHEGLGPAKAFGCGLMLVRRAAPGMV